MFIWIDLRRYLRGPGAEGPEASSLSIHRLSPEERQEYQRRESEIGNRCFENGVTIAPGTNYYTEELGWFRLTFTVSREVLEIGLQRFWKSLQGIEERGWSSCSPA